MSDSLENNDFPAPDENTEFLMLEDSKISEEDRQEILSQIDTVVEENRIPITDELFKIQPKKKGSLFPVLLNIITLVLIGGGVLFMFRFFQARQESLSLETREFLSTEGKLIEELKKESEAQLAEKDSEIQKIQDELESLDEQSRTLKENMEESIKQREDELRLELEQELQAERERLQGQGVSQAEIEAQLQALEAQRSAEFNDQLENFRQETQAELNAKEQELTQARNMAEQILEQANEERAQLEAETRQRETELRAQFEEERAALESRSSEAEAKLQELAEIREREGLISDQIIGSYAEIIDEIQAGNIDAAGNGLSELKRFLQDPAIQSLPSISKRKNVEFFIIENIQDNLETKATGPAAETKSLLEAANLVVTARNLVDRADSVSDAGDQEEAQRLYTQALEAVPALNRAYGSIRSIEENRSAGTIRQLVTAARALLEEGNRDAALEQFRQAAMMSAGVNGQLTSDAVAGVERVYTLNGRDDVEAREQTIAEHLRTIENLEKIIDGNNDKIAALEQDIHAREEKIAGLDTSVEDLEEIIAEGKSAIADMEELLAEREKTIAERNRIIEDRDDTITELENTIADQSNSMDVRESTITRRDEAIDELEERIAGFEALVEEGKEEIRYLNSTIEQNKNLIAKLQGDINTKEETIGGLNEEITGLSSEIADLNGEIESLQDSLTGDAGRLTQGQEEIDRLNDALKEKDARIEGLNRQLERFADELRVAEGSISSSDAVRLKTQGKEGAYQDILDFVAYLSGKKADSFKREIEQKADEDAMYANMIGEIQGIAGSKVAVEETIKVVETKLIGTIASVTAGRVVIEPLVNIPIDEGARILIKRRTSSGEVPIADGEVYSVTAGRISANIKERISAMRNPMVMDLVYMEVPE